MVRFWALRPQFCRETRRCFFLWMFKPQHPIRSEETSETKCSKACDRNPAPGGYRQGRWGMRLFFLEKPASLTGGGNKKSGPKVLCINIYIYTAGNVIQRLLAFSPRRLEKISNLTSIFFCWVGSTTNQLTTNRLYCVLLVIWIRICKLTYGTYKPVALLLGCNPAYQV